MDLSDRQELTLLSWLARDLRRAAPLSTPLLVGAMARDLLLHYGHGVPIDRSTGDFDFAFAVADWNEFDVLRAALLDSDPFVPTRSRHRLRYRDRIPVDLIPFGDIEGSDGTITWPAEETAMGVLGYREALATAVELTLPELQTILTPPLPMLAVLKLLAWSERHVAAPRKDASDLFLILKNYLNRGNTNRLYAEAAHLLEADDFDHEAAGGWLAGHDAADRISAGSSAPGRLLDACEAVLSEQASPTGRLELVSETGTDVTTGLRLLQGFLDGLRAGGRHSDVSG